MRRFALVAMVGLSLAVGAIAAPTAAAAAPPRPFPEVISLPNGFQPEGIAIGRGLSFYTGSLANGAIYRGNLLTGDGSVLVPGQDGRVAVGMKVDVRNRLFVAGGPTGTGRVYDAGSGAELATYQFAPVGTSFVNDVVVTRDAAYFTDSVNPVLYVVPFDRAGALGNAQTLSLTGDLVYSPEGFNLNGIAASPDGRTLVVVQSNKGLLFSVDPSTGVTKQVDLGGESVTNGDGLLLRAGILYVVRNQLNLIAAFRVDRDFTRGTLVNTITDPDFDVPTTIAAFGPWLYAVNARFGTPPGPATTYTIARVNAR